MQTIQWEVQLISPPSVIRHCKQCGKKACFNSSGLFRVNAQKKCLDIWLIYGCQHCDSTWNMTVHSRISPQALSADTLERYYANDATLATQCASDLSLLRKNGAEFSPPNYRVVGDDLPDTPVYLHITSKHPCAVRVSSLLRARLKLSHRQYEQLIESGRLRDPDGGDLKKVRLNHGIRLTVTPCGIAYPQNAAC